jgi:hypothetical protein
MTAGLQLATQTIDHITQATSLNYGRTFRGDLDDVHRVFLFEEFVKDAPIQSGCWGLGKGANRHGKPVNLLAPVLAEKKTLPAGSASFTRTFVKD